MIAATRGPSVRDLSVRVLGTDFGALEPRGVAVFVGFAGLAGFPGFAFVAASSTFAGRGRRRIFGASFLRFVFALAAGGIYLIATRRDRKRGVLMLAAAAVFLVNVLIWTLPG